MKILVATDSRLFEELLKEKNDMEAKARHEQQMLENKRALELARGELDAEEKFSLAKDALRNEFALKLARNHAAAAQAKRAIFD